AGANMPLEQVDLARELPAIGRGPHTHQQFVSEKRLLNEVDGAELHRFDRGIDRAEAGHDHEDGVDAILAKLAQNVDTGKTGHAHVGQNDVERSAAGKREAFLATAY